MPNEKIDVLDKAKVSAAAAAVIIVTIIGAMVWFFDQVPNKKDVESQEAFSTRIIGWVKEGQASEKQERVALEGRLQAQIDKQHMDDIIFQERVLHSLDVLGNDVKNILERIPRKMALK